MGAPSAPQTGEISSTAANLATGSQAGSNYNQFNPYGHVNYVQTGTGPNGVPIYTAQTTFSPQQQQLYNKLTGTQSFAGGLAPSQIGSGSGMIEGAAGYYQQNPNASATIGDLTSGLTSQIMGQETAALDPYFQMQSTQADTQLQNEGFKPGTTGYNNAMQPLFAAQDTTLSGFEAQTMPQVMSQATTEYMTPAQLAQTGINIQNAGLGLGSFGSPTSPLTMASSGAPLDSTSAYSAAGGVANQTYAAQMQQYAANQAVISALLGAGGKVGAAAIG
jgi:hypothetical protein